MHFAWPELLWLLLAAPLLTAAYLALLRRRSPHVPRFSSVALVRPAIGRWDWIRRHLPPLLFLIGVTLLLAATARPIATLTLPSQQKTILMAIDVSLSMRATDVEPNRIVAAQTAAKEFIRELPRRVKVGIVAFAGSASLVQRPTDAREELIDAIDRLQLQRATATGSGLLVALATIFPDHEIDVETRVLGPRTVRDHARGAMPQRPVAKPFDPVAPGSYGSAVIVLLSDGRRTTGPDPLEVAKMAADRGVRVYTVGFGTLDGASSGFDGFSIYMRLDEPTLKAIAEITRGEYFHATSATELRKIYETLSSRLVVEKESTEVSGMIAAFAALLMALAGLLSLRWFSRLA